MKLNATAIVMAKYPEAGRVKTRLTPALTNVEAAMVHERFLRHWIERLAEMQFAGLIVCFDPAESEPRFRAMLNRGGDMQFLPQTRGSLGDRISAATTEALRAGVPAVFFGVDSPDLPRSHIERIVELTAQNPVTIGPAEDGGYWCIAVRPEVDVARALSGIEWSTGREYAQTVECALELGYTVGQGPRWDDVDRPADLERLISRLSASGDVLDRELLDSLSFVPIERLR